MKSTDPNIDVPNLVSGPGCGSPINPGNPNQYIKTQCFAVPNPITLRGNLGRNTVIGPGLLNFDFSLFKNNHIKRISDTFNVQFRAEFFNVLNHTNFAPPLDNRNIFDSAGTPIGNAGLITSTQTPSRQIQFALKIICDAPDAFSAGCRKKSCSCSNRAQNNHQGHKRIPRKQVNAH